ncbi:Hypothetical predicted protein [Scomber scombrus]|uniref:Uncharacterized protein n=1 Tax=Scomber scombrus TaxID=13677 RepID=A0AAV1Q2Q4_SCOSC
MWSDESSRVDRFLSKRKERKKFLLFFIKSSRRASTKVKGRFRFGREERPRFNVEVRMTRMKSGSFPPE